MQGKIIQNIADLYKVKVDIKINKNIEYIEYDCNARGKFKNNEIIPVVGDDVEIEVIDEKNKKGVIEEILERKTYIKRPKLSNITQIIFVVSSNDPKPDLLMLDKQLAFSSYLNLKSVIVLNKTDLDTKQEFKKIKKIYEDIRIYCN